MTKYDFRMYDKNDDRYMVPFTVEAECLDEAWENAKIKARELCEAECFAPAWEDAEIVQVQDHGARSERMAVE